MTQTSPRTPSVSISVRECQEERKQSWSHISQRLAEQLDPIKDGTKKLKTLPDGVFGDRRGPTLPGCRVWRGDGCYLPVTWGVFKCCWEPQVLGSAAPQPGGLGKKGPSNKGGGLV